MYEGCLIKAAVLIKLPELMVSISDMLLGQQPAPPQPQHQAQQQQQAQAELQQQHQQQMQQVLLAGAAAQQQPDFPVPTEKEWDQVTLQ